MTLSTSTVLGNYTHSEPKFIGASPERKDYPISTENCDIKVTSQHAQPGTKITIGEPVQYTKSGVYISGYGSDINVSSLPSGGSVTIGNFNPFEIGDRVRVNEITDPARPDVYKNLSNEFGVVQYVGDICATVEFPQLSDPIWVIPFGSLRKEFTVGDRVKTQDGRFWYITAVATSNPNDGSFTNQYYIQYDDPISGPDSTRFANVWGEECLTYSPKEKGDVHQVSVKFVTKEDIDAAVNVREEIDRILGSITLPQATYAATIVLASGRVVEIPSPNEKDWELKHVEKVTNIEPLLLDHAEGNEDVDEFVLNSFVEHEEGLCWLKDMARIIEQKDIVSPFETKFSYLTEIRKYVRKPIETPTYECTMPALRCLW